MGLPHTFGPLTGTIPLSYLDDNFSAVGMLGAIPCNASGTNSITLTPLSNSPNVTAYGNYNLFSFIAAANATSAVSLQVNAIGFLPLYLPNGATQAGAGSLISGALYVVGYSLSLNSGAGGFQFVSNASGGGTLRTRQTFTSGTALNYTTPPGARQLYIREVGGGGGGGAVSSGGSITNGAAGTATIFNGVTANPGNGSATVQGGAGGSAGSGAATDRFGGSDGGAALIVSGAGAAGGMGGNSVFGGAGQGGSTGIATSVPGTAAQPNSGSGGGGGANNTAKSAGGAGGAGEYVELIINSPAATYTYTVGTGGLGGTSTTNGGNGADGIIIVDEYY